MFTGRKIGFIGFGNMAQALAEGLLNSGALEPEQITACARDWDKLCRICQPMEIQPCSSIADTVESTDLLVLAVKPHQVSEVLPGMRELLTGKVLVSVVAGLSFADYEEILLPGTHHLSLMPNTPVAIGAGIILCEAQHSLSEEEYQAVERLFSKIGAWERVDSGHMGIAGVLSGCGPAFVDMFLEALADGGVLHGLPRALAYRLAGQMTAGAAQLMVANQAHPGVMKDAVCSPGGTTIRGIAALERCGFRGTIIQGVQASYNKE